MAAKNIFADVLARVLGATDALIAAGTMPAAIDRSRVTVEPPRDASHGDIATNAAMVLAKDAGLKPRELAEAIAERLGTTLERDPYPGLLASIATGTFRSSMSFWASSGGTAPLEDLVDRAFGALASGLPETCDLRHVMERKDNP